MSKTEAQARKLLYPGEERQKLGYLATRISGSPQGEASSLLFPGGQEAVGPIVLSENPESPSSLQPLATSGQEWRCLSLSKCGAFSLPSGKPQCCLFGYVWWGRGWREKEVRPWLPAAASHRTGILSPSPVEWLQNYLSYKRDEARPVREWSEILS